MAPDGESAEATRHVPQHQLEGRERARAARAAMRAARHEALIPAASDAMRPIHIRLAALQRSNQHRHLASAEAYRLLAARLGGRPRDPDGVLTPVFLTAVAGMMGATSALATLGGRHAPAAVGASDDVARAAYDLETLMAEGPAMAATRHGQLVLATGDTMADLWPRYGPAVGELGVSSVVAVPLGVRTTSLGALCALDRALVVSPEAPATLEGIATALTSVLLDAARIPAPEGLEFLPALGATGSQALVHQAAGMISVQCGCNVDDATAILAARAYSDGVPAAEMARRVACGEAYLADL